MKKSLFLGAVLFGGTLQAQEPIEAVSKITEVTVYLQNAQITRESQVQVQKGDNIIKFSGLETSIDPGSIQAAAPEMVLLNSVRHEVNYLKDLPKAKEYQELLDSLVLVNDAIAHNKSESAVYTQELQMINSNQAIGSKEKGLSVDALIKMADFYRSRVASIQEEQFKLTLALRKLETTKTRLAAQIGPKQAFLNQPSNDVVVNLKSDYARTVTLALRYVVSGARWVPTYDLRASDLSKPLRLDYRANVMQTTGIDWKSVLLTLSTGDPNRGGTKPELAQWNLYPASMYGYRDAAPSGGADYKMAEKSISYSDKEEESGGLTLADYTSVTEGAVMTEFKISIPQNIPSESKDHQVFVQSNDLPASFRHFAAPKLDKDAFLLAGVTGWESLNLLPGLVNIFFEGTYVSRAMLDTKATSDTLNFSMGRDAKVVISRELLKDRNSQRTIGTNKERSFGYEITIRNTKSSPITLDLQDQVPVSQDASVTVKADEISGATHNLETGLLEWKIVLQPNETKKLRLVYSIKYPKNKVINGI
jgi:uncharacterized protein (TIGR02231 family)